MAAMAQTGGEGSQDTGVTNQGGADNENGGKTKKDRK